MVHVVARAPHPPAQQARYPATRAFDACAECKGTGASGAGSDQGNTDRLQRQDGYASNAGARGALQLSGKGGGGDGSAVVPGTGSGSGSSGVTRTMPQHVAVSLASQADVPPRVQQGPTCGLYALGMVLDYWALRCGGRTDCCARSSGPARPATLPVVAGDLTRADAVSAATLRAAMASGADAGSCDGGCELLRIARGLGVTTAGELFSASYVADVARAAGYVAAVVRPLTPRSIAQYTTRGVPLLVAFDVDADGHPAQRSGATAHWSVVQAVYVHPHWGTPRAVVTHAWTGDEYDWDLSLLLESNAQLRRTDYGPAQHLDLQRTLAHQAVAVWPRCCCATR